MRSQVCQPVVAQLKDMLQLGRERVNQPLPLQSHGTLTRLTGLVLEASGLRVPVGSQCHLQMPGAEPVLAEVVGFAGERAFLMPAGDIQGLSCGAVVTPAEPLCRRCALVIPRCHRWLRACCACPWAMACWAG